ncbi:MAG: enoyl-CoA hydratase/isomerase family protein [Chloroflexia bacterium]|nr:enoyl-CoA hydratase/isomerase family protein [Chloroflexia bacterium]
MVVDLGFDGVVATITIDRPEALNALDVDSLESLRATVSTTARRTDIRVIILTGAGERAFVAGADVKAMAMMTRDEALAFARLGHATALALETAPQPVIAAVNGFAFGGGCELALACDIRIASFNAVFAQPEVSLGIPTGWGGSQRLPRIVGPGVAAELIFTGRRVAADEALRIGLVNAVHEPTSLMPAARKMAEAIAANGPFAVRAAKRLMGASRSGLPTQGLAEEARTFADAFDRPEQREGMAAFVEKRAPSFASDGS